MRDYSEWPQRPQKPKDFNGWNIKVTEVHVEERWYHDEKIKLVPTFVQVWPFVHHKTDRNLLYDHLEEEANVEHEIDCLGELQHLIRRCLFVEERIYRQLERTQDDQCHHALIPHLMLHESERSQSHYVLLIEDVEWRLAVNTLPKLAVLHSLFFLFFFLDDSFFPEYIQHLFFI